MDGIGRIKITKGYVFLCKFDLGRIGSLRDFVGEFFIFGYFLIRRARFLLFILKSNIRKFSHVFTVRFDLPLVLSFKKHGGKFSNIEPDYPK